MGQVMALAVVSLTERLCVTVRGTRMRLNNLRALFVIGALIKPADEICAETVPVTPHNPCSSIAAILVAKPIIDRPEVAPIPVARAEIASVDVAGKEKAGADALQPERSAVPPQVPMSLSCLSPSPIGVRYAPDIRKEKEAEYERKRPRDPNDVFLKQAASKVEVQLGRLGASKSGNVFISAFITNKNDFALQQITLRCDYNTKDGPKVISYVLSEVIEPASLGPATINYTDHHVGTAPPYAIDVNCQPDELVLWSPGEDIQSRR
jgi:hypothetical protein